MLGLYFLGTSSGVPTKERNVSGTALMLPTTKDWILIDCGEGTQHQILSSPLSLLSLKAICITHVHGDHCYGLPGLLASAGMSGRTEPLDIIAPKPVEEMFQAIQLATDLHLPYDLRFIESNTTDSIEAAGVVITPVELSHRVESHAFTFVAESTRQTLLTERLIAHNIAKGPLWGEIQQGKDIVLGDGKIIHAADYLDRQSILSRIIIAGDNDDLSLLENAIVDADVLVHEATYTEKLLLKAGPGPQHSSAQRVAAFAERVALPNLVLTHFSARFQPKGKKGKNSIDEIRQEAENAYSGNLFLANDHDELVLSLDGKMAKRDRH